MADTVLIVDDDPVQRRLLEAMVQRFGYRSCSPPTAATPRCALLLGADGRADRLHRPRSRDARPRRPRRARPHARSRPRHARHRADGAWRHRQRRLGDARGRRRFRREARWPRAAAGLARAMRWRPARWPANCAASSASRTARFTTQTSSRVRPSCSRCCARPTRQPHPTFRCWCEGESGIGKELIARAIHGSGARSAQTVRRGQLRRDAGKPGRVDPVRSREGRLHRRDRKARGQIRRGGRRHVVP